MNGIFFAVFTISIIALCFVSPNSVLSVTANAGEKSIKLCLALLSVYAFWLGVVNVMEDSKINDKISLFLKPSIKKIFGNVNPIAERYLSLNLSTNLLGMGGIATPMGISAVNSLYHDNNIYAINMLVVIASTSIQLIPMSVLSLRASFGSNNVNGIILPTLLSTFVSTFTGIILVKIFYRKKL